MKKALIGKKLGMTQIFDEKGVLIPVTVVEAGPCQVTMLRKKEKDGYDAIQLGFSDLPDRKVTKPMAGHFKKADAAPKKYLKEFALDDISSYELGGILKASVFAEGDVIDVTGISKGKGFAGVIKRWNHHRVGSGTHGTGPIRRSVGSMGSGTDPGRVMPGKHMAGHLGSEQVTIQNLVVVKIDDEKNILAIKGAIPGPKGGLVYLKDAVKNA